MADEKKPYFRVIQTINTEARIAGPLHQEKLNNYLKYGEPFTNADIPPMMPLLSYEKEVKHESTSTAMKDHTFIITTTLCCEDEYEEDGE